MKRKEITGIFLKNFVGNFFFFQQISFFQEKKNNFKLLDRLIMTTPDNNDKKALALAEKEKGATLYKQK